MLWCVLSNPGDINQRSLWTFCRRKNTRGVNLRQFANNFFVYDIELM